MLCDKKVEIATMEENYKGQMSMQTALCEKNIQAAKTQEKLLVSNYEEKINHLQLQKELVSQNCDLK
jgi:membrane peptidoglycan carboxypeptidase